MLHFQGSYPRPLPIPPTAPLFDHIFCLLKDCAWPLHSSIFPHQGQAIAQAISLGMAHGDCDRVFMDAASLDFATAAWLLEDIHHQHKNLCHCITHVSGPPADVNAYCAGLQGLHALLLAIKDLCSYYAFTSAFILVGCNNTGALH